MFYYIALALFGAVLYQTINSCISLRRNIAIAKNSGIPYLVLPFTSLGVVWAQVCTHIFYPILKKLPYFKDALWVPFLDLNHSWTFLQEYSDQIGNGHMYLLVSPFNFFFVSSNAEANSQIATRRIEFEKPIEDYVVVNHFGRNMLSSEGADWRRQRKMVAPAFSERSNAFVWEQSLQQAQSMLEYWSKLDGNTVDEMNIANTQIDTANLALHVICGAGLGVPQLWPHEDESILGSRCVPGFNTTKTAGNHTMDFKESLRKSTGIEIVWLTVLPRWLIRRSPFQVHKILLTAYDECQQYFRELFEYKRRVKKLEFDDTEKGGMDLMGPLVKASENAERTTHPKNAGEVIPDGVLTEEEIMGNSFVFIFAGHETSAGTLHYAMIHLAMHPTIQFHLQGDIDSIVGSRPVSSWSYTVDLRNLYNSMVGAVLSETLRLTPPVVRSPKINRGAPKQLTVDGRTITLPGNNTYIHLDIVGSNYNPHNFPTNPSKITPGKTDIAEFVPERWLTSKPSGAENTATSGPADGDSSARTNSKSHAAKATLTPAPTSTSTSTSTIDGLENASFEASGTLFRPARGAFITFADGARACPGRRFVQVEITAVLAVIFSRYSVELDVRRLRTPAYPDGVSDAVLEAMAPRDKGLLFAAARESAWARVRAAVPTISLKMEGEGVPLRFVRRGSERWTGLGL